MRSNPMARIIIGAATLTLLVSSAVSAQADFEPPPDVPGIVTSVIIGALDDPAVNEQISDAARAFHLEVGGVISNKKDNGWLAQPPLPSTGRITERLLEVVRDRPSLVIVSGGDGLADVGVARDAERTHIIDLGQGVPCVTADGKPDPSGTCAGGTDAIPFNYTAVDFAVEDGAYLAGLLAAAASRNDRLGIISGSADCVECNRYVRGFVNGARSIDPEIDIQLAYLADDEAAGFGDAGSARTFTEAFIDVYQPDVLLPIGRGTSAEMIEAACAIPGVLAVGTGIDVGAANPDLQCVLTSIVKDVASAVTETTYAFARGEAERAVTYGLTDGRVSVTRPTVSGLPVDTAERYREAETGILTGQIDTCPGDCGAPLGGVVEGEGGVEGEGSGEGEGEAVDAQG